MLLLFIIFMFSSGLAQCMNLKKTDGKTSFSKHEKIPFLISIVSKKDSNSSIESHDNNSSLGSQGYNSFHSAELNSSTELMKSEIKGENNIKITRVEEDEYEENINNKLIDNNIDSKFINDFHSSIEENPNQTIKYIKKNPSLAGVRYNSCNYHPCTTLLNALRNTKEKFSKNGFFHDLAILLFDINIKHSKQWPLKFKSGQILAKMVAEYFGKNSEIGLELHRIIAIAPTPKGTLRMTEEEFFKEFSPLNEDMLYFLQKHSKWIEKICIDTKNEINNTVLAILLKNYSNTLLEDDLINYVVGMDPKQVIYEYNNDEKNIFRIISTLDSSIQEKPKKIIQTKLKELAVKIDQKEINILSSQISNKLYEKAFKSIEKKPELLFCEKINPIWIIIHKMKTEDKHVSQLKDIINNMINPEELKNIDKIPKNLENIEDDSNSEFLKKIKNERKKSLGGLNDKEKITFKKNSIDGFKNQKIPNFNNYKALSDKNSSPNN